MNAHDVLRRGRIHPAVPVAPALAPAAQVNVGGGTASFNPATIDPSRVVQAQYDAMTLQQRIAFLDRAARMGIIPPINPTPPAQTAGGPITPAPILPPIVPITPTTTTNWTLILTLGAIGLLGFGVWYTGTQPEGAPRR